MGWCNDVDFVFGLAQNERLIGEIKSELDQVAAKSARTGRPQRRFKTFLSSPRCDATRARPSISTRKSIARAATWRTGSRSASSTSMRTAPRPPPCGPISCDCGSPRWPMCCCARCDASGCTAPPWPTPPGDHPAQTAQGRCSRAHQCSPHQIRHGIGLSRRPNLGYRRRSARARCSCARLSSLTRPAAPAIARGAASDQPRSFAAAPAAQEISQIDRVIPAQRRPMSLKNSIDPRATAIDHAKIA